MAKGSGVFMDIHPRLDMALLDKLFGSATKRAGKASDEMAAAFSGHKGAFGAAATEVERYAAKTETAMRAAQLAVDRSTERQIAATDRVAVAEKKLQAATVRTAEVRQAAGAGSAAYLTALASQERATRSLAAAQRELSSANGALLVARSGVSEATRRQEEAMAATAAATGRLGTAVANTTTLIGVGMAAAMVAGASKAADMEKGLKLLETGAGESVQGIDILRNKILDLQSTWGTSVDAQNKALLLIERAGYRANTGAGEILAAGVQAAKAEGSNLETVVNQLTTTMADFHIKVSDVNTVMSQGVETARMSKTTLEEYARAIGTVEKTAANAGMNIQGLNAAFAVMTQHGYSAENSTQLIKHAILTLQSPQGPQTSALNQFGISTVDVQKWLADPNLQIGGTVQKIREAVEKQVDPTTGRVKINPFKQSIDAKKALATEYEALNPFQKTFADRFSQSGEVSDKSWRALTSKLGGEDQSRLNQWFSQYQKLHGFNDLLRKGMNPDMSMQQAQKAVFGDQPTLQVAQNFWDDEDQKSYYERMNALNHAKPDANGNVLGSTESQKTLKAQWANLKGSVNTDLIKIGEVTQGPLTSFVSALASAAQWLGKHETAMQYFSVAASGAAASLLLIKMGNWVGSTLGLGESVVSSAVGRGIRGGARQTGRGARAGARGVGRGAAALGRPLGRAGGAVGRGVGALATGAADLFSSYTYQGRHRESRDASRMGRGPGTPRQPRSASTRIFGALSTGASGAVQSMASLGRGIASVGASIATHLKAGAITGFTKAFTGMRSAVTTLRSLSAVQKVVAAGTKAWAVAQGILNAVMAMNPIGLVVIAIAAIVAGLIYAYTHSEKFRKFIDGAFQAAKDAISSLWEVAQPIFESFKNVLSDWANFIKDTFGVITSLLTGDWSGAWEKAKAAVSDAVKLIKDWLSVFGNYFKAVYNVTLKPIFSSFETALSSLKQFFVNTVTSATEQWEKLKTKTATPIKWIIQHVYSDGIRPLWNKIDKVFGGKHQLSEIKFNAAGGGIWQGPGTIPGYAPGTDSIPAVLSKGESVLTPEASRELGYGKIVELNKKSGRRSANEEMGQTIRASGGFLGSLGDMVSSAWDGVKTAAEFSSRLTTDPVGSVKSLMDGVLKKSNATPGESSDWRSMMLDIPKTFVSNAIETAKGWVGLGSGNGETSNEKFTGTGQLGQWLAKAMSIAGVDPDRWGTALYKRVMFESSGNPNAINLTDRNAKEGHPSKGLGQLIDWNFQKYRDKSLSNSIYDPIANLVAMIGYIKDRYKGIEHIPPIGTWYAGGGINATASEIASSSKSEKSSTPDRTAVERAHTWLRGVLGTPYTYGGMDCSMLISGIYQSLLGRDPSIRAFNTTSDFRALGFKKGQGGLFTIGVLPKAGTSGHMAATFDGQHVEATSGKVATMGPTAAGADDAQFTQHFYLPGSKFNPAYTGTGATPSTGQQQANTLTDKAESWEKKATKARESESKANASATDHDKKAQSYDSEATKYDEKSAQALLPSDQKTYAEKAAKARERAAKQREAATKAREKATKYKQQAEDYDTQAKQATSDASAASKSGGTSSSKSKSSTDYGGTLITPHEAGEKIGGYAADAILETLGLDNTLFADPSKSYLIKVGNAILNPFAKLPAESTDSDDTSGDTSGDSGDYLDDSDYSDDTDTAVVDETDSTESDITGEEGSTDYDTSGDDGQPIETPSAGEVQPEYNPGATDANYQQNTYTGPESTHSGGAADPHAGEGDTKINRGGRFDQGGYIMPGVTLVENLTGVPEPVLAPREKDNLSAIARMGLAGVNGGAGGNNPRSFVHIENYHQGSGEDGQQTARKIAREMLAYSGGGAR